MRTEGARKDNKRGSAAVDGGDNDGEGKGATTRTEDEDINWDEAAEGIGERIEGPEGIATAMMTTKEGRGDEGATRRKGEKIKYS